jgi:hypothetical protein
LEKHCRLLVIEHLSVPGQRLRAKRNELTVVGEKNGSARLLIVVLVARVEYFDARLA